jgi:4-alpha-glucanotransferase
VDEFKASPVLKRKYQSQQFTARVRQLRALDSVDYAGVSKLKFEFFEELYRVFCAKHLNQGTDRDLAFQAYVRKQGRALQKHAVFSALLAHFSSEDKGCWGWPAWPEAYQDHQSDAVQQFAKQHADEVNYWCYLQFIAEEQLDALNYLADSLGMKIGLYRDLAVGADRGGAEVWSHRENFCLEASIGAPPDALGPTGQNWGLPPLDPIKLKEDGYEAFITLLRNNMKSCGALRIDHALALLRLWWCPPGADASYGAYVYYDLFDMLGLLNLESVRNECMVIAEDLGTVPEEVTRYFPQAELYSNKVFYFEMNQGGCTEPQYYPEKALAIVCNHDMPTVNAYWDLSDLQLRKTLGMFATEEDFIRESDAREHAKYLILDLLQRHGNLPEGMTVHPSQCQKMTRALNQAIHYQLASTASQIIAVQLEDMMEIKSPVNVPGTSDEYPNWRRKLVMSSTELFAQEDIGLFCRKLSDVRHRSSGN